MLNLLILNTDKELTKLTVNSIKQNMPEWQYDIVNCELHTELQTALNNIDDITLVVKSGVCLELKSGDLAPYDTLFRYHLCATREGVYTDNKKYRGQYNLINKDMNLGVMNLDIFIMNPHMDWSNFKLADKKILAMPRYLNHKQDVLTNNVLSPYGALNYGILGESAAVLNYVDNIKTGEATIEESYAYNFDKLEEYTEGMKGPYKDNIIKLSKITKRRLGNLRNKLYTIRNKYGNTDRQK